MAKTINYPSDEWIDNYIDTHEDSTIEEAETAWWDNEIAHDRPTPYDLTAEQEKASKSARRKMAKAVDAYGKQTKRERKENPDKRTILCALYDGLLSFLADENRKTIDHVDMPNPERQLDFTWKGVSYSVTLTAHRPKKGA
jgi:hypothetical protein